MSLANPPRHLFAIVPPAARTGPERNRLRNDAFLPAHTAARLGARRRRMLRPALLSVLPLSGARRVRIFSENAAEISLACRGEEIEIRAEYARHPWITGSGPRRVLIDSGRNPILEILDPSRSLEAGERGTGGFGSTGHSSSGA